MSAEQPRISVCMATYNGSSYIREQVSSVLPQLGPDDELVIVDDASTDTTVEILKSYNDPRITSSVNERNLGPVRSFERALQMASGDLIFLCDQDDIWCEGKIAHVRAMFESDATLTLVSTNTALMDENGNLIGHDRTRERIPGGLFANLFKNRYQGCTMAFRKAVVSAALPFPKQIPMHDSWIGLVNCLVGRSAYIEEPLVLYRRHQRNVTRATRNSLSTVVLHRWWLVLSLVTRSLKLTFR
jgi:glycosyltransferase involved in cell wall biosynthesis